MSTTYLVPTKYTCDTYGCEREAMGHTPFRLTEKNKLELDSLASTGMPEGWSHVAYDGDQCPACTTERLERAARDLAAKKAAMEAVTRDETALREAEAARRLREQADAAMKTTAQTRKPDWYFMPCPKGCPPGRCNATDTECSLPVANIPPGA